MRKHSTIYSFVSFLLVISVLFSTVTAFAVEPTKKLKVGFSDDANFIEENDKGGFSGYSVDVFNKISELTGLEFDFVYVKGENILEKLKNKEIDIIATSKLSTAASIGFTYSENSFCNVNGVVYTKQDNKDIYYEDFSAMRGKTIGFSKSSAHILKFSEYAAHNKFIYKEKFYDTDAQMTEALNKGEVDIIATENIFNHSDLKMIGVFNAQPYYLMSYEGNNFLNSIDYSLSEIQIQNPLLRYKLEEKYFKNSDDVNDLRLTREEVEYINNAPVFRVSVSTNIQPMGYNDDKTGELLGINTQILQLIAETTGLKFEFFELDGSKTKYEYEYFRENNVDLLSAVEVNEFNKNTPGLSLTNPYFTASKSLVARQGEFITANGHHKIAIVGGSGTLPLVIKQAFPNYEILTYKTIEECLNAIKNKEADVLLYNQYLLENYINRPQFENLSVVSNIGVPESLALSPVIYSDKAGVENKVLSDPKLISILNKAIDNISDEEIESIIIQNTVARLRKTPLGDVIYEFRIPFTIVLILLVLCIALLIFIVIIRQINYKKIAAKNIELAGAVSQAEHANNAKSQFLSRMSHEIRTPMNAIVGLTEISKSHLKDPEKMSDYLNKIDSSSKILLNIINDVLDMSAIENDKLKISKNIFDIKELLSSISTIYYAQCKQKNVKFEMLVSNVSHEILIGDPLRTNQILLNLISNAYKFTPSGGEIRVLISQTLNEGKAYMQFAISDTGVGMSDDLLERLFKPFEQEDSQTAQKYGGSGLGLSITKNLVELMQGSINVKSQKNVGTTFTVTVPYEISDEIKFNDSLKCKNIKALVVDDDKSTRDYTAIVFDRIGVNFNLAENGNEALDLLQKAHCKNDDYDVCFVDWKMPDMDGIAVTKKIRELYNDDTIIIIVSAYDLSEVEDEAKAAGANMFISKPLFQSTVFNVLMTMSGGKYTKKTANENDFDFTGKRVLLVEDNALNTEIATDLLNMVNMEVDHAENGQQAFDMFVNSEANTYDAILMDIQMPILDGYESTKLIRESSHLQAKTIPIIAMTANAFTEDVTKALSCGMNDHVAKPIDTQNLYQKLKKYTQGA